MTLGDLALRCSGRLLQADPATPVTGFQWDSRNVQDGDVFLAIRGERVDGHDFIEQALESGAVAALCEQEGPGSRVLVESVIDALGHLGRSFRSEFVGAVVGITGSVGKTTAKDMTAAALSPLGKILKTTGNQNTEITVPLMCAKLREGYYAAVFELGMRGKGQIAHLASIVQPSIAMITRIGLAHAEKVGGPWGVYEAKTELVRSLGPDGIAVLPFSDPRLRDEAPDFPGQVYWFGAEPGCQMRILDVNAADWTRTTFVLQYEDYDPVRVQLPLYAPQLADIVAASLLVAVLAGAEITAAASAISRTEFSGNRWQPLTSPNGARVVMDAYNASPESMSAAVETVMSAPGNRKLLILGEMLELGDLSAGEHEKLGTLLVKLKPDKVLLFGEQAKITQKVAQQGGVDAEWTDDYNRGKNLVLLAREGDVVLLKGSRGVELERCVEGVDLR
jgi:UDP-N-acetylmuramoyl-tripeptide--D-alanyl-D-alanine ligase